MTTSREGGFHYLAIEVRVAGLDAVERFYRSATIGRTPENDVVIDDRFVSTHHVELRRHGDRWEIRDLETTNGTFIDGERIERATLGPSTSVRLGHPSGPELRLTIPGSAERPRETPPPESVGARTPEPLDRAAALESSGGPARDVVADRYLGEEEPENMSDRTRLLRLAIKQRRREERGKHRRDTRVLKAAVGFLLLASVSAAGVALTASQRSRAQRLAAADLFHTIKSVELEIQRLRDASGTDASFVASRADLERQYEELLTTLGIYSEDTDEEVQTVYRVVHKFGESEVNVPREFVDEVLQYVESWRQSGLGEILDRAAQNDYGSRISAALLDQHLPPEFFYLALQESGFRTNAVGPETRLGFAKGMWQFIPQTAERYGLQPGPLRGERLYDPRDERHDFEKATRAAARYLYDIYTTDAQASGLLVMASYNWGEDNVVALLRSLPESPKERNFWNLLERHRRRIPEETYDYVLKIVSAAVIGENPGLFGFDFDPPLSGPGERAVGVSA